MGPIYTGLPAGIGLSSAGDWRIVSDELWAKAQNNEREKQDSYPFVEGLPTAPPVTAQAFPESLVESGQDR